MKKGFTLLEILIVVIILAILAALAIPQMINAVERGRAAEAYNNLGLLRQAEFRYYAQYETYTTTIDGLDVEPPVGTTSWGNTGTGAHFNYAAAASTDITKDFKITATRKSGPFKTTGTIAINEAGTITATKPWQ